MIRPLTIICICLFLFAGFYDYQTTHRVDLIDQQISNTRAAAADARGSTKLLQTEWSWLNRPDRLQPFAAAFLSLQEVTPTQYVPLAQLTQHLPQAGALPQPAEPITLPNTIIAVAQPKPDVRQSAPPVQVAAAEPVAKRASEPVTTAIASANPRPADVAHVAASRQLAEATQTIATRSSVPMFHDDPAPTAAPAAATAKPIKLAAAPKAVPKAAPKAAAPRIAVARNNVTPPVVIAHPRPLMVADNMPPRAVTEPHSYSSLGMAQSTSALPPPVAVTNASYRAEQ